MKTSTMIFSIIFVLILQTFLILFCSPIIYLALIGIIVFLVLGIILFYCSPSKKHKIISGVLVLISIQFIVTNCLFLFNTKQSDETNIVVHAGGAVNGKSYLNCKEGFLEATKRTNVIELDFLLSSDDEIICSHKMEYLSGFSLSKRPSLSEFENTLLLNKYHGITFNWLIQTLKEYPNLKIIVDSKEQNYKNLILKMLEKSKTQNFDLTKNFILQLYSKNNYESLCDVWKGEFWFTNYKANYLPNYINSYFSDKPRVTTIVLNLSTWILFKSYN